VSELLAILALFLLGEELFPEGKRPSGLRAEALPVDVPNRTARRSGVPVPSPVVHARTVG